MTLSLGHFIGREGVVARYAMQSLPPRPSRGKEVHYVSCNTCHQVIDVTITDEQIRSSRRALKFILGLILGLTGVIMAIKTANTPSDPVTFEQPGYVAGAVWGYVALVIVGLCFISYSVRDTGAYLRIPGKGLFGRFAVGHRVIDR